MLTYNDDKRWYYASYHIINPRIVIDEYVKEAVCIHQDSKSKWHVIFINTCTNTPRPTTYIYLQTEDRIRVHRLPKLSRLLLDHGVLKKLKPFQVSNPNLSMLENKYCIILNLNTYWCGSASVVELEEYLIITLTISFPKRVT